jgi:hypothetical protein
VKHAAEVVDTWFAYDRDKGTYRYYTRLRLTNEFRKSDLKDLPPNTPGSEAGINPLPELQAPVSVTLQSDTAKPVPQAGLILLLGHVGARAELYVLSGESDGSKAIVPYSGDRTAGEPYVAWLKTALHSCNGRSAKIGGYTAWCFLLWVDSVAIDEMKKNKAPTFRIVTAAGRSFDLSPVDADRRHWLEVRIRPGK